MKIFPPLPGANKCQNDEQYIIHKNKPGRVHQPYDYFTNTFLFKHTCGYTREGPLMWYSLWESVYCVDDAPQG